MHYPVHSHNGWECPRAILLRRQYRTSITVPLQHPKPRSTSGPGRLLPLSPHKRHTAPAVMFFATFSPPLISIPLVIHAAAAVDQIVLPNVPMVDSRPASNVHPTLFDLLTIEPGTSIFFSYARELELSRLFVN